MTNRCATLLLAGLVLAAGAGCRSVPVAPSRATGSAAAIGLSVRVRGPLGFPTYAADTVYFVRRCSAGVDCDGALHPSNHATDGRLYWLNAPPGDYVAVAVSFTVLDPSSRYVVYFPEELSDRTSVRLAEGDFAYAGTYMVSTLMGICEEGADPTQMQVASSFSRVRGCGLFGMMNMLRPGTGADGLTYQYRAVPEVAQRGEEDRLRFLERAKADLAESGWAVGVR